MNIICPHCNSQISLEQASEDKDARRLFALLSHYKFSGALIGYLSLFKPPSQSLRWSRALKLAEEVLQEFAGDNRLESALITTVSQLRNRGGFKQLKNHNYLKQVLGSLSSANKPLIRPATKTGQAIKKLQDLKR